MREWKTKDKTEWGLGEWSDEPDKAHWVDEDTGLDCLIVRNSGGALCGYVGVPKDHRLYAVEYDNAYTTADDYLDCHGGLTYAGQNSEGGEESEYIYVKDRDIWWLGFDCAHLGDVSPKWDKDPEFREYDSVYRNISYVREETTSLAKQIGSQASA